MSLDTGNLQKDTEEIMKKAINHLEVELSKVRAGKVSAQMLDGIMVDYYGNPTPINQVANIMVVDARTLTIQAWEKNMLQQIDKAILQANIGVTPQNDGIMLRIFLPPTTEERRRELVKKAGHEGEFAKVAIRNLRRDAIEKVKKMQKDGMSEDAAKDAETDIQQLTDRYIALVDKHLEAKEKEIMHV